jgi:hypothetical protein
MGRRDKQVLKVRYRMPGKTFRSKFTISGHVPNQPSRKVLSVRKVSGEQLMRVGEYLPFDPDKLLKELREVKENAKEDSTNTNGNS